MPVEDVRKLLRRNSFAFVRNREPDVNSVPLRSYLNDGGLRRVPSRVRKQVAENLNDSLRVGHHPGQIRGEINLYGLPAAAADESIASLVNQADHPGRLWGNRQCAGPDAPCIQQIADQIAHVIGLLVNDAEELDHLRRVEVLGGAQHRGRRALDRGQWSAQLMAHHPKKLRSHSLDLPKRLKILHCDDHRHDLVLFATNRRGVDQHSHASAIRHRENNLFSPHRLCGAKLTRQGVLLQGDLPPVLEPAGDDLQLLLD